MLVVVLGFNHPNICWKSNTGGHKQTRMLEYNNYNLMIQELTRRDALLVLMIINKEELVRDVKVVWGDSLGHSSYKRVKFSRLRRILLVPINTWREAAKRTKPGCFQWCTVKAQEAVDGNFNTKRTFFFTVSVFKHWSRSPREFMESPSLEMFRTVSTWSWAACCSQPCFEQGSRLDNLQRPLPMSAILLFCF